MKKNVFVYLAIALLIVGTIGGYMVRSSSGSVEIFEINIPDNAGTYIHATVFKPDTATAENPAPVVVALHGYADTGEKQDFAAIELSRRGAVVFEMDALSHGLSTSSTFDSSPGSTMGEAVGMIRVVDFINKSNMDYIDKSRIGITGHSMGGMSTDVTIQHFGALELQAIAEAQLPESAGGAEITPAEQEWIDSTNAVEAAFIQSAVPPADPAAYVNYRCNVGVNYTLYDEGGATSPYACDMTKSPAALTFVNSVLGDSPVSQPEMGKFYGSAAEDTLRVMYNVPTTHTFEYMTPGSAVALIEFFNECFDLNTSLADTDLVFLWRYVFTGLGLLGLVMLIPAFASALLGFGFFSPIIRPVPKAKLTLDSKKSKGVFWGSWIGIAIITLFLLVPVIRLDAKLFPVVANMGYAKIYTSTNVNSYAIWLVFISLVSLALFLFCYKTMYKQAGLTIEDMGIKISGANLGRTILLALGVFTIFYVVVNTAYYLFHIDYRFWYISAKPFIQDKLWMWIQYMPWFFVYMLVQSITTNVSNRIAGQKHNLLIVVVCSNIGLALVAAFAYIYLFSTGASFGPWAKAWDRVTMTIPFIAYTAGTIIISRKCFEKTGSIWMGTFINTFIVTMMMVANTSNFYLIG